MTPFLPRQHCLHDPTSVLYPGDVVGIAATLAWSFEFPWQRELGEWHRALALALFEHFELARLPQCRAVADTTSKADLSRALGAVEKPAFRDALGRAWMMRSHLLSLPALATGVLEGHPFVLAYGSSSVPEPLRASAQSLSDALLDHTRNAIALAEELDRSILVLWGCPIERLKNQVTMAELQAKGLELRNFED